VALLAVCLGISSQSWALGLGEIEVDSALNERFKGSIELLDGASFQSGEVVVSMASREDFRRVGVERFFYLTDIEFQVDLSGDGKVNVTSSQPISEPYLNFIVEVLWPQGKLLKEFTVLLDPPTFSDAPAPAISAPAQPVAPARPVAEAPRAQPAPPTRASGTRVDLPPAQPQPAAPVRRPSSNSIVTTRDDTLWKIASRTLPSNRVSVNQHMLAIQRTNPSAFIRNNINLIKAGYTLDIPTEQQALSVTTADANLDVAAQTRDWRSGATTPQVASNELRSDASDEPAPQLGSQLDATQIDAAPSTGPERSQGQVRIVANTGELASGTATGVDQSVNQLIEEKETLGRQVDELTYQLDREKDIAVNQVTVKDRQLEVKDAEIAHLQEQMKEIREQLATAAENQNQSPKPDPADVPWWMSPLVLFGVIGVLILALVGVLIGMRRSQSNQAELYEPDYVDEYDDEAPAEAAPVSAADEETAEPFVSDIDAEEEDDDDYEEEEQEGKEVLTDVANAEDDQQPVEPPSGATQTGDVIGESEIYIAYGRYGQAASLLGGVLNSEPDRWDVRLKLLEVFAESQDEENFASHAQYIVDNCDDEDVLMACRDLEAQLESAQPDDSIQDEESPTALQQLDDGGLEADADTSEPEAVLNIDELDSSEDELTAEETGLDFELEFDAELEAETPSEDLDEGLGGDLGLEFDADADSNNDDVEEDLLDLAGEQDGAEVETDVESAESDDEFDFDAGDDSDVNATKLDLAEAYLDMDDADGASDILREVLDEGTPAQQQKAQEMLDRIAS